MKFSLPVTLDSANRKKDKSLSVRFTTNLEVSTEDFATIDRVIGNVGWLAYSDNEIQESDLPQDDAPGRDGKSPSQRLAAVQFVLYKQTYPDGTDFDSWRKTQMEKIIQQYKDKLND